MARAKYFGFGRKTGCGASGYEKSSETKGKSAPPPTLAITSLSTPSALRQWLARHRVSVVAVGSGQGTRAAQESLTAAIKASPPTDPIPLPCAFAVVSEAGASVYSASSVAKTEFPTEDISVLGAVSIARRLIGTTYIYIYTLHPTNITPPISNIISSPISHHQYHTPPISIDPLAELVKIPPSSLGTGMYQHDMSAEVGKRLTEVVQLCVSKVGVDVNTASAHLLAHVSGLTKTRADALVSHRAVHGPFRCRASLRGEWYTCVGCHVSYIPLTSHSPLLSPVHHSQNSGEWHWEYHLHECCGLFARVRRH